MPNVPQLSGDELIAAMGKLGFARVRQAGSQVILKNAAPPHTRGCSVPRHKRFAIGTLRGVPRQAGVALDELLTVL